MLALSVCETSCHASRCAAVRGRVLFARAAAVDAAARVAAMPAQAAAAERAGPAGKAVLGVGADRAALCVLRKRACEGIAA